MVAQQKYALVDQELELGLRSLAVPIVAGGPSSGAINIGLRQPEPSRSELLHSFLPVLQPAAKNISSCLGNNA